MEVEFYCSTTSGTNYFEEFLMSQPPRAVKKIWKQIELLRKYGVSFLTHSGTMKKLHGYDLWEIVVDFGRICYRIFCVFRNSVCHILHGFIKKSNRTPMRDIKTALKRAEDLDFQLSLTAC